MSWALLIFADERRRPRFLQIGLPIVFEARARISYNLKFVY